MVCDQSNAVASLYESAVNTVLVPDSSCSSYASPEFSGLSSPPSSSHDGSSRPSYSPHAKENLSAEETASLSSNNRKRKAVSEETAPEPKRTAPEPKRRKV